MKKIACDLFLRDLNDELRKETEKEIKNDRLDLIKALEENQDIVIGSFFTSNEYKVF